MRFAQAAYPLSLSSYTRVRLHVEPYHKCCVSVVIVECETLAGTVIFDPVWSWPVELPTFGLAKTGPHVIKNRRLDLRSLFRESTCPFYWHGARSFRLQIIKLERTK